MVGKDDDTSSDERSTVTSKLRSRYICSLCDREFKSGHALGGHYNVHSKKRKRKYVPGTAGRVIRVPVPSIDVEPPVAPRHGSEFTHGAPTPGVQSGVDYETGDESMSTRPQGGLKKNMKLNIETHRSHPYERAVNNEAPRGGRLLNITTVLIHGVKINNGVDMDLARTITNPIVEVSRKENGDTKFTSGKNGDEDLDLELRLGLGPA